MAKVKKFQLVQVTWIDSYSSVGWKGSQKAEASPLTCYTVGHLITSNRSGVVVAANSDEQGHTGDWMTIPRSCVKRVRRLR